MSVATASKWLIIVGTALVIIFTLFTIYSSLKNIISNPMDLPNIIALLGLTGLLFIVIGTTLQRIKK